MSRFLSVSFKTTCIPTEKSESSRLEVLLLPKPKWFSPSGELDTVSVIKGVAELLALALLNNIFITNSSFSSWFHFPLIASHLNLKYG